MCEAVAVAHNMYSAVVVDESRANLHLWGWLQINLAPLLSRIIILAVYWHLLQGAGSAAEGAEQDWAA